MADVLQATVVEPVIMDVFVVVEVVLPVVE